MPRNKSLGQAKIKKDDEYYTRYEDIQNELNHYEAHFKGKTILCNCDDPFESNFCKFFLRNFNYLGLRRLICTSYYSSPVVGTQMEILDYRDEIVKPGNGYVMDISKVPMANGRGVSDEDITKLLKSKRRGVKKLKGNGDFRSEECIEYLKQADIVVTNPPFSQLREFIHLLVDHKKQFLIIGNQNALHYKDVFPLIRNNEVWLGYNHVKEFYKPDGTTKKFGNVLWYTNLDIQKRHEELILYKHYSEDEYRSYMNFDGIDVNLIGEIPCDYEGYMGVPDTFLEVHNPDQFEVCGLSTGDAAKEIGVKKNYRGRTDLALLKNGKPSCPYSRIIIKRKVKES